MMLFYRIDKLDVSPKINDVSIVFSVKVIFRVAIIMQENSEWIDWQTNALSKRNALENVYQWACGYVIFCLKSSWCAYLPFIVDLQLHILVTA